MISAITPLNHSFFRSSRFCLWLGLHFFSSTMVVAAPSSCFFQP